MSDGTVTGCANVSMQELAAAVSRRDKGLNRRTMGQPIGLVQHNFADGIIKNVCYILLYPYDPSNSEMDMLITLTNAKPLPKHR